MQDTEALIRKSIELERAQRFGDALSAVVGERKARPQDRRLALRHAQLLETMQQIPHAITVYRQLMEERPETQEAELVIGLARCLLKAGQLDQAEKLFTDIHAKLRKQVDVLTGLATCHRKRGALDQAEKRVREALEQDAGFKPAVHELAEIQLAKKETDAAIRTVERNALREDLFGDSLDLWLNTLKSLKRDRYAQEHLQAMARKYPHKVEFIFGVAVLAHRNGEVSVARPAFVKSAELSPNNSRILHEWGVMERMAGDIPRSQQLLSESLALNPEQPAALRTFGNDHKYAYGDPEFTRLNYAAARLADVEPIDQIHLHYAVAKAFEDVNELDTAFRHYAIGGEKKRKQEAYDERASARMFQVMAAAVNAQTYALAPQQGCDSEVPVFILGMPRSGTSLLEQILSSHPDVFGAGELKFASACVDNIQYGNNRINLNEAEAVFPYEENASWALRGQRYVEKLEQLADKPHKRIVDKMPGNFTVLALIRAMLPKARIIHSRRHPVETCLSNYRIHFAEGQHWSYNLRELGRYYKRYWFLMKHWREQFPGAMYEVRYEDNVADVEGQARKLIDHLGLEWNDACLEFYNTDRPVKTASASQVRKPIYTTSTNRWRKFEKYLAPLLEELGEVVPEYEAEISHLTPRT